MLDPRFIELMRYVRVPVEMNVKPGEQVLIVADTKSEFLVLNALATAVHEIGAEPTIVTMVPRRYDMEDPTEPIKGAMTKADVVFLGGTKSLIHAPFSEQAMNAGARFVNLEGTSAEMLTTNRETLEDYEKMHELGSKIRTILREGSDVKITSAAGTDLTASIAGRPAFYVAGVSMRQPGVTLCAAAYPDGEAATGPVEEMSNGVVVTDISMLGCGIGRLKEPIRQTFKDGRLVSLEGGAEAQQMEAFIAKFGDEGARWLAEIAIGINPKMKPTGTKSDKKIYGTVHIGLGRNVDIGGTVESHLHMDGVLSAPTVYVDGQLIVERGKVAI